MLLSDDLLEAVFGLDDGPAVMDPETEHGARAGHELPSDDEEFAAPPHDEP